MSRYSDRFARAAAADASGFINAVVGRYGLSPANLSTVLKLATKLHSNDNVKLSTADIEQLQRAYTGVAPPHVVAHYVSLVNNAPAAQRADMFCASMVGDDAVLGGDYVHAGDAYRHARGLMEAAATLDMSEAINARRGGSADASPAWSPPPGSVRESITEQLKGRPRREMEQRLEQDDPQALEASRHALAAGIEQSSEWLARDDPGSLHDTVSAAFDLHQGESIAQEQFGIGGDE